MRRKLTLKMNEVVILSYIDKYKRIDLYTLEKELNAPLIQIAYMISNLHKRGYIKLNDDNFYVSEEILKNYKSIWNDFENNCKGKSSLEVECFEWDYLYIPLKYGEENE